jgi:hypothetical protein
MPFKPHPTDPEKMVYASRQYNMPDTPTARVYLQKVLDEDDDIQVYKDHGDALTIAYQSGYYDGKKAAQRPLVGLTDADWKEIEDMPDTFDQGVAWCLATLKRKNT